MDLHHVQRSGTSIERVLRPATLDEAFDLWRANPEARPVAGGTDLLLDLARGETGPPVTLLDLSAVVGFTSIVDGEDEIVLSGGVTHNQIVGDQSMRSTALPLAQACLEVGSPQLRNRATVAGNLVTASPANDTISALMALDASVALSRLGTSGDVSTRRVPVAEFFSGFRQTVLEAGELITAIHVPKLIASQRGIWVKLGLRKAQAISVVHGAIVLTFDGEVVVDARLGLGSVAATVILVPELTQALVGHPLSEAVIEQAATAVAAAISPIDDIRATADYRLASIRPLIVRSLGALRDNQQASMWPKDPPLLSSLRTNRAPSPDPSITDNTPVQIRVNGTVVSAPTAASVTLLDWLRDQAAADGVKEGCAEGECGACTVHLDGAAVMSCLVSAAQAADGDVTTIEGLAPPGPELHVLQQAFIDEFAAQCGFCIPGFLMAGARLLEEHPDPTEEQILLGLSGNLCRCTGYYPIVSAMKSAAASLGARS